MNLRNGLAVLSAFPAIPMPALGALEWLCGGYREAAALRFSSALRRVPLLPDHHISRYWRQYQRYLTPASICSRTAIWLWRCLERVQPRVVLEFGVGFSTLLMAVYAQERRAATGKGMHIVSAESDAKWCDTWCEVLAETGLSGEVHLLHSPLKARALLGRQSWCYSGVEDALDASGLYHDVDFVFVDGPPGLENRGPGRFGSIAQAVSLTQAGGMVLVHDALRKDEYTAIKWIQAATSPFRCLGIVPLWYGLAICEMRPPIGPTAQLQR